MHMTFVFICASPQGSNMDSNPNYSTCVNHIKGEPLFFLFKYKNNAAVFAEGILGGFDGCLIALYAVDMDVRQIMIMWVTGLR